MLLINIDESDLKKRTGLKLDTTRPISHAMIAGKRTSLIQLWDRLGTQLRAHRIFR